MCIFINIYIAKFTNEQYVENQNSGNKVFCHFQTNTDSF